jgi:hypothetical protein
VKVENSCPYQQHLNCASSVVNYWDWASCGFYFCQSNEMKLEQWPGQMYFSMHFYGVQCFTAWAPPDGLKTDMPLPIQRTKIDKKSKI